MREVVALALWAGPLTAVGVWGWQTGGHTWAAVLTAVMGLVALLLVAWDRHETDHEGERFHWSCTLCGQGFTGHSHRHVRGLVAQHKAEDHA